MIDGNNTQIWEGALRCPFFILEKIDYKSTEKRGKWSLNRNNRKNEKIKKKQLTRGMKGAIIAKSLVRQSISTKKLKKFEKSA